MGHLNFFPNHTGAISRAKMAAPVRADIRMSRLETPKTYWATNHATTAATAATQRAARMSMTRSSIPNSLSYARCLAELAIQFLVISCQQFGIYCHC